MIDDHDREVKTTTTITTNIWFSKRDNPTVIRYRYYEEWRAMMLCCHRCPRREHACERVRAGPRCSSTLAAGADASWLSQSLRVVCSRYTRVAESVDHARSRPTLSTKQNRYKYNQMSSKVNKLKRSREQWMVCVLEYCVKYLRIQLYKLIQKNKLYTTDNIKTAVIN